VDVEKVMIWHEYEAYLLQVKQIGTSACGPTAILTVLVSMGFDVVGDMRLISGTLYICLFMKAFYRTLGFIYL
jgi:hypothetical protein